MRVRFGFFIFGAAALGSSTGCGNGSASRGALARASDFEALRDFGSGGGATSATGGWSCCCCCAPL